MKQYKAIGWIIVGDDGGQYVETNNATKKQCVHYFVQWWCAQSGMERDWKHIRRIEGYRCVRVYVEVKP